MRVSSLLFVGLLLIGTHCTTPDQKRSRLKFSVTLTKEMSDQVQDGRLLLLLSTNDKAEPRNQISDGLKTQLVFGIDVEGVKPGDPMIVDASAFGFPIQHL